MPAELTLGLPWIETAVQPDDLVLRQGPENTLRYEDGIVLGVHVIPAEAHASAGELVEAARDAAEPGRVVLVAGGVPVAWRANLREAGISFVDRSGIAEIDWPRLRVSARHFGTRVERQRSGLPLQKGHALVTQELLIVTSDGERPNIAELSEGTGVSVPTASRAVSQLAEHGLVMKHHEGTSVTVEVVDRVAMAARLAERTAWPGRETLSGYLWGRTIFDVAARISEHALRTDVTLGVTGRVAAAYYGVLGTTSPAGVHCWVKAGHPLEDVAEMLGLDPAATGEENVVLSSDPRGIGVHRRRTAMFDDLRASVAHPLRVWCDLRNEPRGSDFAAQMWEAVVHA